MILGANGQVGRAVFRQCCHDLPNAEVIGCVRHRHLHFEGCTGNTRQHSFDFDPFVDDWKKLGKADVLINCIGIIRETGDLSFRKAHIGLTRLVLQHREMLGMPRIIQVSVLGADKRSPSGFMSTKAEADEELMKEAGTFVVRPSIVCTHNTMMVKKLKQLGVIAKWSCNRLLFPSHYLQTRIQPVTGEDMASVITQLAKAGCAERLINITGPEEIRLEELLNLLNNGETKLLRLSKRTFNMLLPVAKAFGLINSGQLTLLSEDNVAGSEQCERLLGRKMSSTREFWKEELKT